MEIMEIDEPTQDERTGFMQRWRERWRERRRELWRDLWRERWRELWRELWRDRFGNLSLALKIIYPCFLLSIVAFPSLVYLKLRSNASKGNVNNPNLELQNPAAYYIKSLDQNTQPCEDFYAFACGNLRNEYRKENEDHFDTMAMMEKQTRISLDDFLTKPLNTSDSATLRHLKIFHQMCINKTKAETEGIEPVLTLLKEIGGWPLLTNDSKNNERWETIVGSVNRAGFATFFPYNLKLYPDPNNSSSTVMLLVPILGPQRPRVLPNGKRTTDYVKRVALLLNATNDRLDYDVKNIIDFESDLQEVLKSFIISLTGVMRTLESLTTDYPEIAWKTFFRNAFVSTGIEVSSNETIIFSHLMYNTKVSELLNKTSANIIRNYVVWRLIVEAIPLMPEKFREAKNAYEHQTVGQSRNFDCVDALINNAKVSIGYLYIKNYLDGHAKNKSDGMIKNIKSQAYQFLKNISWMDKNTNSKIIETLTNSEMMVPRPDDNIDVMETLEFQSNDTIFANYRRLAAARRNFKYNRLRMSQETDRQLIPFEYALNADSYYFPLTKITFMLAAIFQRPFFSASQPMYLNYGGIGFSMAHEMTNAMQLFYVCEDETCPSYDRFQEREDCMEKLYGGYVLEQLNAAVDGKRTVRGNIGDLIGLKLSYRAYEEFAKGSKEPLLPGLNYTARQWFWINAATSVCSFESDTALRQTILKDSHSPAEARVNVAFANTDEFSRDFECPIGSRMNPVRKCGF